MSSLFLHCHFYSFWGDYWFICSNIWWACWGKSAVWHPEFSVLIWHRGKSSWAVWELQLIFQMLQINIFCTVMITRNSNFSQAISWCCCAFTFCFKTIQHLKAEPCTLPMPLSTMCFHFPDIITMFNIYLWYTLILCTWMLLSFHNHLICHPSFCNSIR